MIAPPAPDALLDARCARFLADEARALDEHRYDDWLAMLTADIRYEVPVRTTRMERGDDGFSTTSFLMREDLYSLTMRVDRLRTKYAWAEDPASRNRHLVVNVAATATDDGVEVRSSLMLVRSRLDAPTTEILTADRHDLLVEGDGSVLRLARRVVYVDQTTLQLSAITTFL